jgi:outer membrane biosynthesis protein TonB
MPRTKSFSLFAFFIALMVHFIVFLGIVLFNTLSPKIPPQTKEKKQESRFKISLKERPKTTKEALVKNEIPKITKAPPMPKGEQLKKLTSTPKAQKSVDQKPSPKAPSAQPNTPMPEAAPTPPEPKRAFERHVAPQVATIERQPQPKKEQGLYDFLSKADPNLRSSSSDSVTKVSDNIQKLYGDKFGELSAGEQKYILDNQETMRRITQTVLSSYAPSRLPDNLRINSINTVEFYLYPNGNISDLKLIRNSKLELLDEITKKTIEYSFGRYPHPAQKTYIRYQVYYDLQ